MSTKNEHKGSLLISGKGAESRASQSSELLLMFCLPPCIFAFLVMNDAFIKTVKAR